MSVLTTISPPFSTELARAKYVDGKLRGVRGMIWRKYENPSTKEFFVEFGQDNVDPEETLKRYRRGTFFCSKQKWERDVKNTYGRSIVSYGVVKGYDTHVRIQFETIELNN
jgi:hypothetical protein